MIFSKPITELINERTSWRTYVPTPLEKEVKDALVEAFELKDIESPFGAKAGKARFGLVGVPEFNPAEKKKIGTYGVIQGAQEYIVGAVEESDYDREHFGYLMEYLILFATDLNLGTCWLGGFFNRGLFSTKFDRKEGEILPAITSIGYLPEKRRSREKVIRKFVKADKRLSWDKIFFDGDFSKPLIKENVAKFEILLEMVRLYPSAGNKQPCRIVKESDKDVFHFYMKKASNKFYKPFPPIDMGIATCHWDLTAKELGIKGEWEFNQPDSPGTGDLKYIISWKAI